MSFSIFLLISMTDQFIFAHHSPLTIKCQFSPCFNKPSLDATPHSVLPVPLQISLGSFIISTPSIHDHFSKVLKHVQVCVCVGGYTATLDTAIDQLLTLFIPLRGSSSPELCHCTVCQNWHLCNWVLPSNSTTALLTSSVHCIKISDFFLHTIYPG